MAVIVLSARMAKADGIVAADEVKAFKEAFKVSPAEMKRAAPVFNSAKRDAADFEACAEQLVELFRGNRKLLEDVLEAKADAEVHRQEEQFLGEVARRFGFTPAEFKSIKARHLVADKRDPYDVLGVEPSIGDEELERLLPTAMPKSSSHAACRRSSSSSRSRGELFSARPTRRS